MYRNYQSMHKYSHVSDTLEIDSRTRKTIIHEQNRVIRLLNAPGLVVLGHSVLHPKDHCTFIY